MQIARLLNFTGDRLYTLPLLVLYLTDGCNSRCVTCDIWHNERHNMPMPLFEHILAEVSALKVKHVLLSGGEALQHPEWPIIVSRLRAQGVKVMLLTNGLLVRKFAQQLAETVDELIVSLDAGNADTYTQIRGVDAFDLVLEGIREVRALGLQVTTRTTVQKANFREIPQIIDVAHQAGVNHVSFLAVDISNPVAFGDRFATHDTADLSLALTSAEVDELASLLDQLEISHTQFFDNRFILESPIKLKRILTQYFRAVLGEASFDAPACNAPHFSVVIDSAGKVSPCYFLPAFGRVRAKQSLRETINSEPAQALRRAYRQKERAECARCVCPLYKSPRDLVSM